jgi:pentatricopeptide repeat protein
MWEEGIPRDVFSWNAILRASLASSPDTLATEKILDEMWEDGVDPIASSYNMIIESYAAESNIVECQRLLKLMLEYGIKPNTKSFLPIVQVFAGVDPEKAYQIIKDMQRQNIEPDVEMYNLLIDAWAQKGSVKRASQIVAEMKREGIFPNEWTLSSLVRGNFAGMHSLHTVEKFVIRLQRAYRTKKEHRDAEIARLNSHLKLYENDFSFPKPLEDNEFNFDVC